MSPSAGTAKRVVPVLALAALSLLLTLDYASVQPNRIMPGTGVALIAAIGTAWSGLLAGGLLLLAALAALPLRRAASAIGRARLMGLVGTVLLCCLPFTLSTFIQRHISPDSPYARVGLGPGFWCLLFFLALIMIEVLRRARAGATLRLAASAAILAAWAWCLRSGSLDTLSLIREYHNRTGQFRGALEQHLALSLGSVGISLIIGFFLAIHVTHRPKWQRPVFALVNFIQTVPSLALFGLLIAPLSALSAHFATLQALGIRGIGWAPAALALIAYSLLPMVRNTYVALTEVPADVVDAGRGMGMSDGQLFRQVKLPLALPVIIEGVRVTTIQAIGLTAVAALIGAGGFGDFIFQGLGQAAMDLVLLGALPTIALAVIADALLSWLARQVTPPSMRDLS